MNRLNSINNFKKMILPRSMGTVLVFQGTELQVDNEFLYLQIDL